MSDFLKKEKISLLFAIVICAISTLFCVARYFPTNVGRVYEIDAEATQNLKAEDVLSAINCSLDTNDNYKILGSDPQLLFDVTANGIEAARLSLSSPAKETVSFEVYTALESESFTAEKCYVGCVFKGQSSAVVDLPLGDYRSIRLDIDNDKYVVFESLDLYDEQPEFVLYTPKRSANAYVFTVIIPLVCAALAFFANRRFRLCEKTAASIKKNIKTIAKFSGLTLLALPIGALVEWVLCNIERQGVFNAYRWIFFVAAIEIIFVFILLRRHLAEKPENVFLPVVLIIGFAMVFGSPIKHICWDLDSHYPWAVHTSYSDTAYLTAADICIDNVASQSMVGSDFNLESYKDDLAYLNEADNMLIKEVDAQFSIAHLPTGLFIAVARMFGASFAFKYNLGRVVYLLIYAFVCYFAIKKIKSGKMILATICLFPTCLFLATNYAYDWCVTAFTILGTAYFVSELQQPDKPIVLKDIIIMGCAFVLGAWSKLVYIILMSMTLFMCKNWRNKKEIRRYYFVIISIFVATFCYFAITTLIKTGAGGDTRGGNVDPIAQIKFILSNPIDYSKILVKFLRKYLSIEEMRGYISNFAYLGVGKWWPVFVVLLGITAATDSKAEFKFKIPIVIRLLSIVLFVGMAALIATALFINFTPIGSTTIAGCQPRYIIPLLAPLLLLVTGRRKDVVKEKDAYNGFVLLSATAATMCDVYSSIIVRMI